MRAIGEPVLTRAPTDVADPFVLAADGWFYLYHTGHDVGVPVYRSRDLVSWSGTSLALAPDPAIPWAACDFWAPEVVFRDGLFYMYVAATSRRADGAPDDDERRLAVAHAETPMGPFELSDRPLIEDVWAIDAHPFQDTDGSWWMFYNVRNDETRYADGTIGCGNAVARLPEPQRMSDDRRTILVPTERWEGNADGSWYWNEGAFVVRRGQTLLQTYSGGWFADGTYAIGTATADRPDGPWRKNPDNPLLVSSEQVVGPGHDCIVTGPDGFTDFLVYHAHADGEACRSAFIAEMHWVDDGFVLDDGSPAQPARGGYDASIPFWRIAATLPPNSYRFSTQPVTVERTAKLEIRQSLAGVTGTLNGEPLHVSLGTVDDVLREVSDRATYVEVRSGLKVLDEMAIEAGDVMVVPWTHGVATTVNVVVAGHASVAFGDDSRVCGDETPQLVRIESDRGGSELQIRARGAVTITGIEMVPRHLAAAGEFDTADVNSPAADGASPT
ncbi:glycoside hydrolase family 43 protein [Mycolicibacterium sp. GCM10028919]|uniref:glycoside hydrolase family 43 protein n=1 Tax=Mycolicibacterium sp. GCM10028919 TaxID=3273401 RepID=UPI00361E574F